MTVWAKIEGYEEEFKIFVFEKIMPFHQFRMELPFATQDITAATRSGKLIRIMANPHLTKENITLTAESDATYWKTLQAITCHWHIRFGRYNPNQTSWAYPLHACHAREGVAMALNMAYMYSSPEFAAELNGWGPLHSNANLTLIIGLIYSLVGVPNGVVAMSFAMPGLVETSTNLASVKFEGDDRIVVTSSQRSSVESAKTYVMQMVESVFALAGADVAHSDGYPGWTPDPQSKLLAVTAESYERLFGVKPKVRAIHAGLECGLFLEKYPDLEMVSFGPTLRGVHSPDERLEIATVDKFWRLLLEVLRTI